MEQKLSNEEIARVFAMYYGNQCLYCRPSGLVNNNTIETVDAPTIKDVCLLLSGDYEADFWSVREIKLLLTTLSSISDEDAIQVAKMYGGIRLKIDNYGFIQVIDEDNMVPRWFTLNQDIPSKLFQVLIGMGYAVPLFFGIDHPCNGMTAIELGIAITKQP